jgi:DNA (cytosine-5)-methyltransferase 1
MNKLIRERASQVTIDEYSGKSIQTSYEHVMGGIKRRVTAGAESGEDFRYYESLPGFSSIFERQIQTVPASVVWARHELLSKVSNPLVAGSKKRFNVIDLFCGCGGFSLGVRRAIESVGGRARFLLAVDSDKSALEVYQTNHRPRLALNENVANLLKIRKIKKIDALNCPDVEDALLDARLERHVNKVDIFIAGPPCEGNSNFNNHSRRVDVRNDLYISAVSLGIKVKAKIILIENVEGVFTAAQNVIERSSALLREAGYSLAMDISQTRKKPRPGFLLSAADFSVAQTRKRHFLIATLANVGCSHEFLDPSSIKCAPFNVEHAISDLIGLGERDKSELDRHASVNEENLSRIHYLFDNNLYNLPDEQRPDSHRLKKHSYPDVYSRIYPNKPVSTLTTGFTSNGRGRYTHPFERRTLTLHEGARLQGFPDSHEWGMGLESGLGFTDVAKLIGDAVPPNLGMAAALLGFAANSVTKN